MIKHPSGDHELQIDWKGAAPRWVLIALCVFSFGLNGLFGAAVTGLVIERFRMVEHAQRDPLWDVIGKISATQAEQNAKLKQHDETLQGMSTLNARMIDMQAELRIMNERLRRKGL